MLRNMPLILLIIITSILFFHALLPLEVKQVLYATSLTIKSFILMFLPIIIFSLLFKTMINMARNATIVIALIIVCVCLSNFTSTFLSHYVGAWIYHFDLSLILPDEKQGLVPTWSWQFPSLIGNDKAMLLGILLGMLAYKFESKVVSTVYKKVDYLVTKLLDSFTYLIPAFIAGFMIKMQDDGVMYNIIKDYGMIFAWVAMAQFIYLLLAYTILNQFNIRNTFLSIKNMLPAAMGGFSTMSSAAVMPLTIKGVESNAKNKSLARSVVPATVNIHLIGDCFAIPIFAYAVMKSYGIAEPALWSYLVFTLYFVMAKFSVAAIPGGGIIVMLPILESYLGFNAEMLSLMTALYILFDPVITCANVFGNGAFTSLIDKVVSNRIYQRVSQT
jgi:hypothetical protein